ncbi:MAG TPA: winged helix-turn-helix domain-containing protein [Candidatus Eisenbacteria bacterium]|nr:winged helix-turn-helix domain-containing protein [Candidatus Eisenbacteria bacterium]
MEPKTSSLVRFGECTFDLDTGELRLSGTPLKLQPQPAKVLAVLIRNAGQVVTRQKLVDQVWGAETFVDYEQGLNYAIRQIRTVLEDDAEHPRFLETLPKRGYRFIAPLTDAGEVEAAPLPAAEAALPAVRPKFPWRVAVACLVLGGIAASVVVGLNWERLRRRWRPIVGGNRIESLAVLPLHNLSQDPEQEYFSDGMTDELITDLAKFGGLRVISHTSVERYKGTQQPLPEIARELGVDAVVEGTVMRSGDRVRITAQLIDARTDTHLWAETYQRDMRDVLALQDELSRDIAEEVRIKLTPEKQSLSTAARKVSPEAYDAYLHGRHLWLQRNPGAIASAIDYFQQAIREDPSFALAYSGLADCYWVGWGSKANIPLAEQYARKAIALQPELAEGYVSLGVVLSFQRHMAEAGKEFRRALELNQNYAMAHHLYAGYLLSVGHLEDALAESERARRLDPFSIPVNTMFAAILIASRKYDRAVEHCRRFAEQSPQSGVPYLLLARIYWIQGRVPEAIAERRKLAKLVQSTHMMRDQNEVNAAFNKGGVRAAAMKNGLLMERNGEFTWASYSYGIGQDGSRALECWEQALREGDGLVAYSIKTAPEFDFMHADSRYQEMLHRLDLMQ